MRWVQIYIQRKMQMKSAQNYEQTNKDEKIINQCTTEL